MRDLLSIIKRRPIVTMLFVALFGAALYGAIVPSTENQAMAAGRDCNSNAIMYCGAHTAGEFQQKYNENKPGDLAKIYAHYGVNPAELNGAKDGVVTKDGKVMVGNQVVATGAYTVGRTTMPQSHTVNIGGKTYYERNNTSNFNASLEAFVVLDQYGRFKYAVIKSCGNPVPATPTQKPPVASCDALTAKATSRTQFDFTAKATAANGATITGYAYDFGDGVKQNGGATISHTYAKPGTYKVTVTAKTNIGDKTGPACQTTVTVEKEKTPGVSIEKLVNGKKSDTVVINTNFNYTIAVTNTGDVDLTNVMVTDNAPEHVEFVSTTSNGKLDGNKKWSATIPSLKKGEKQTFTIVARATQAVEAGIKNTACVDAKEVPGDKDDCDDATVYVPPVNKISVCDLTTKQIITIEETAFDSNKHSKNVDDCKEAPVPPELPQTGAADAILSIIGLGAIIASSTYYVLSRIRA